MTDIGIFGLKKGALTIPGQNIIGTTQRETVIANPDNFILVVGNAGPYLGVGIFGSLGGEEGDSHKILIPGEIVQSFHM
jgi:hypothetical protein